jgi:hypothetical protein
MRGVAALMIVAALTAGGAAWAQTRGPLFVSPMGEPFRAGQDGAAPIQVWFAAADADHDGKLSRAEFIADAQRFFAVVDANHDGAATSVESTALYREQASEIFTPMAPLRPTRAQAERGEGGVVYPDEGTPPGQSTRRRTHENVDARTGAARYGLLEAAEPVMSCDTDMSRRVTPEEFQACAERRFAELDADGDGFFAIADSRRAEAFAAMR